MLDYLNPRFRIVTRQPPSAVGLAELRAHHGPLQPSVEALFGEASAVEITGPGSRYFRFYSPERCLQEAKKMALQIPNALPIGSDGGGNAIVERGGIIFLVSYATPDEPKLSRIADGLQELLANPEPLWPWIDEQ